MMRARDVAVEYRLTHWAKVIQDCGQSGLTIKAYCENAGIPEYSYYYYLKKLREVASDRLTNYGGAKTSLTQAVFAEVRLPAQPALPGMVSGIQNHICIETAAGVRLTASIEYPVDKLAELLRVVSRECC